MNERDRYPEFWCSPIQADPDEEWKCDATTAKVVSVLVFIVFFIVLCLSLMVALRLS